MDLGESNNRTALFILSLFLGCPIAPPHPIPIQPGMVYLDLADDGFTSI